MVQQACNLSITEVVAGGVQRHPWIYSNLEISLETMFQEENQTTTAKESCGREKFNDTAQEKMSCSKNNF